MRHLDSPYEGWPAISHSEVYAPAFRDPCSSGTPAWMVFSPDSIAFQSAVSDKWTQRS